MVSNVHISRQIYLSTFFVKCSTEYRLNIEVWPRYHLYVYKRHINGRFTFTPLLHTGVLTKTCKPNITYFKVCFCFQWLGNIHCSKCQHLNFWRENAFNYHVIVTKIIFKRFRYFFSFCQWTSLCNMYQIFLKPTD